MCYFSSAIHVLSLSSCFYFCHTVINDSVTLSSVKNVLCESCVVSVVMYVLPMFYIFSAAASACLSRVFESESLTLQFL